MRFFLFLLLLPVSAFAQFDFPTVEDSTKKLFIQKNWDELLTTSEQAILHGTDFYDMRLRRGLAYFEKKQYRAATREFKEAQRFFPADTASRYYLCLTHDLLGNQAEAQQYANFLPAAHQKALGKRKQHLLEAGAFGSYTTFDAENQLPTAASKETGEWTAYRGLQGGGAYVSHIAGKRWSFLHTASGFLFQNFKKVNYPNQRAIFYNDGVQIGGGSHAQVELPKQWRVNLSLQYNHISTYTQAFNNTTRQYATTTFSKGGLSIGGYVEKGIRNTDWLAGCYWNNFLGYYTLQETFGITWFPFGNARLSVRGQASFLQNLAESNPDYQQSSLVFGKVTAQVLRWAWLSASYIKGDTQNFFDMENNAIYYTADRTKRQAQVSLFMASGKHLRYTIGYTFIEREGDQYSLVSPSNAPSPLKPIAYKAHGFTGALGWKF